MNSRSGGVGSCQVKGVVDARRSRPKHGAVLGTFNARRCAPSAGRPSGIDRVRARREWRFA